MTYFEESLGGWLDEEPSQSAEDEYLASLEPESISTLPDSVSVHDRLKKLTARQRFVVEMRYGMRDGFEYSIREIAEVMGLDHSVVAEHEKAALRRLKTPTIDPHSEGVFV